MNDAVVSLVKSPCCKALSLELNAPPMDLGHSLLIGPSLSITYEIQCVSDMTGHIFTI